MSEDNMKAGLVTAYVKGCMPLKREGIFWMWRFIHNFWAVSEPRRQADYWLLMSGRVVALNWRGRKIREYAPSLFKDSSQVAHLHVPTKAGWTKMAILRKLIKVCGTCYLKDKHGVKGWTLEGLIDVNPFWPGLRKNERATPVLWGSLPFAYNPYNFASKF